MQRQELRLDAVDRATLQRLSRPSNARGIAQLAAHAGLLAGTGTLVWAGSASFWLMPALLAHGIVLDFLFCALHETIHRTAFASRRLNGAVAWTCGALLVLPPEYFRSFHFAHHRFTQDPARDPELTQPPAASLGSYLWRATGLPNWAKRVSTTLGHALTAEVPEPFVSADKRGAVIREARILWVIYAAALAISLALHRAGALLYWIIPAMVGQPFLRLYLMSEHLGCALNDDPFANTRTTYTNAAVRQLAWHMPFHVEHHAYPAVPFHALAKLNAHIRDRITVSAPGYLALHRNLIRRLRRGALRSPH
jgi:fatty acid desaturase